jgi:hypothetical protein
MDELGDLLTVEQLGDGVVGRLGLPYDLLPYSFVTLGRI